MKLYGYFRSSASYRLRIALNLKKLDYQSIPIHLTRQGGEQFRDEYVEINPQGLVPSLEIEGMRLGQSIAIMEYLDEREPEPQLLPADLMSRAYVRQLALIIACDVHPLNNLRVLNYLGKDLALSPEQRNAWVAHWIILGFGAFEQLLARSPYRGRFCCGDTPSMADCCLIPQLFNARRFGVDLMAFPLIKAIELECENLEAFRNAAPAQQADAE